MEEKSGTLYLQFNYIVSSIMLSVTTPKFSKSLD